MFFIGLVTIAILTDIANGNQGDTGHMLCAFTDNDVNIRDKKVHINALNGTISQKGKSTKNAGKLVDAWTQQCNKTVPYCFTLWLTDSPGPVTLLQGCWSHSDKKECANSHCIANSAPSGSNLPNNTRFCCCYGNFCNRNVTDNVTGSIPARLATPEPPTNGAAPINFDPNYKTRTIVIATAIVMAGVVIIIVIFVVVQCYQRSVQKSPEAVPLDESPSTPHVQLDSLKLDTLISGGRFSEVYTGTLNDINVAVKVFNGHTQRQYYANEREIYSLPCMDHTSLLTFYGTDEQIGEEGHRRYLVVLEYMALGTLTNHLKHNTVDWAVLCRMCRSIAGGLSHLHSEIKRGGKKKPAVAHRDLNSRNVLVRADLGCVLCDFGFAMQIEGSKIMKNGTEQEVEQSSLTDVGTRRYMAPEILEGAVNLRDCEASLKQIDVYACGLLFWEVGSRCTDMYQGLPVPEYQLPFQAELGPHPTFEDMQMLVSKNKARPLFPNQWKNSNQAIRAFKETIEDCWDQDGEARLTALCVEERITEIEVLWARHKGVPTINTSNFELPPTNIPERRSDLCNMDIVNENDMSHVQRNVQTATSALVQEQNARNLVQGPSQADDSQRSISQMLSQPGSSRRSVSMAGDTSLSSVTTDTLLSPLENTRPPNVAYPPNSVYFTRHPKKPLYSHQGENPTMARNTHKASDEDLEVQGNALINKQRMSAGQPGPGGDGGHLLDAIVDNLQGPTAPGENEAGHGRTAGGTQARPGHTYAMPRIPFMQNDVASEPLIVRPKQPNVQAPVQKKSLFQKLGLDKASKLSMLFGKSLLNKPTTEQSERAPWFVTSQCPANQIGAEASSHEAERAYTKSNLVAAATKDHVTHTEVCLVNGQTVVRAADLSSNGYTAESTTAGTGDCTVPAEIQLNDINADGQSSENSSDFGIDLFGTENTSENGSVTSQPSRGSTSWESNIMAGRGVATKNCTQSSTDLSPTNKESLISSIGLSDSQSKAKRPNSLVLASCKVNSCFSDQATQAHKSRRLQSTSHAFKSDHKKSDQSQVTNHSHIGNGAHQPGARHQDDHVSSSGN